MTRPKLIVKVSWSFPSGTVFHMNVPRAVVSEIVKALDADSRVWEGYVEGMKYRDYVKTYGGTILDNLRSF